MPSKLRGAFCRDDPTAFAALVPNWAEFEKLARRSDHSQVDSLLAALLNLKCYRISSHLLSRGFFRLNSKTFFDTFVSNEEAVTLSSIRWCLFHGIYPNRQAVQSILPGGKNRSSFRTSWVMNDLRRLMVRFAAKIRLNPEDLAALEMELL